MNNLSSLVSQKWYLLGQPWTHSEDAGTAILAGSEDPHVGYCICDCQDFNDEITVDEARSVAAHIVELHNAWLVKQRHDAAITEK